MTIQCCQMKPGFLTRIQGAILLLLFVFCCREGTAQKNFIKVVGHQFIQNDNKNYYFTGANFWHAATLGIMNANDATRVRLIKELDFLKNQGITNLRVMTAVEGRGLINGVKRVQPALQVAAGVFDDRLLTGIDFLLSEMAKRNMKAVLYLSNNWEWSGGFLQYVNWFGLVPDSTLQRKLSWDEQKKMTSQFYSCQPCKDAYLKQVHYIINRENTISRKKYKDDPTIMAWQLANEPRPMLAEADQHYANWIEEAADYIKKLDKNHLVSIGHEGYMGTDGDLKLYEKIHASKNIDYLTIHIWAKNWSWFSEDRMQYAFDSIKTKALRYIKVHQAISHKLNKPLVIEEFGLPRDNHAYSPHATTRLRDRYFEEILNIFDNSKRSKGNIAGVNFWAFGTAQTVVPGHIFWKDGDDYTGDPPMEEQGLNTVFDTDASTWKLLKKYK